MTAATRRLLIIGNWKMNLNRIEGITLVQQVLSKLPAENTVSVIFAPSFINLYKIAKISQEYKNVFVASQDCSVNAKGAYTGEVSANMIASCNVKYIIFRFFYSYNFGGVPNKVKKCYISINQL